MPDALHPTVLSMVSPVLLILYGNDPTSSLNAKIGISFTIAKRRDAASESPALISSKTASEM